MKTRKSTIWIAATGVLALLIGINIGYRYILADLRLTIDDQIGAHLGGLAESFASTLDPETVQRATTRGEIFSPEDFLRLWNTTRAFTLANNLVSVTLLDSLWNDKLSDDPGAAGPSINALLDREGMGIVHAGLPWVSATYQWEDNYYRSAAAPIIDTISDRIVAIVRLEADAQYFEPLDRLNILGWWIHSLSAVFAAALTGLFVWNGVRSRRWEQQLLHSEKLIGLGRLAATIAHDIKNPLGIIKATAQRLTHLENRSATPSEDRLKLLRFIPEETDRLDRILGGYLRIADPKSSEPVPVNVEDSLSQWLESVKTSGGPDTHPFELTMQPTGPILADPDSPRQVVINLVCNAVDASPPDAPITIRWEPVDERFARLTVADRGPGIPRKHRQRIFEPFYTTKSQGSGLGLYAVQMLVERDDGRIEVSDNPGGGTRFTVSWPLAKDVNSERGS